MELDLVVSSPQDCGLDEDMKRYRPPPLLLEFLGWQILQVFFLILDHRELQRNAYLRSCQPHSRGVVHRLLHIPNQSLHFVFRNFPRREGLSRLPQNRVARLDNFQSQSFLPVALHLWPLTFDFSF
jgi:hypothetical protein